VEVGLVDVLTKKGIPVIGPTRKAGQIEWDKAWAREFGERHKLPQPSFKICFSEREGINYLKKQANQSWFIKAAYLAEGKGALPAKNNKEAIEKVKEMKRFGKSGKVFLIEKWLKGEDGFSEEFSTFVFSDGENYKMIGSAQDHKRANNFDEGENTGGMGCSAPPLVLSPDLLKKIEKQILDKAILALNKEGRPYRGVFYLGGMLIKQKGKLNPYVIEFNARWGDPEAQVILPGLTNDLFEISMAIAKGDISNLKIKTDGKARVVVAGASRGYPGNYQEVKGKRIYGLDKARKVKGVKVYGAGIKEENGKYYANGGRLFYIVGEGKTVIEARRKAYEAMSLVYIEGNNLHFRTDIGWRDIQRLQ
ncbi:phosphoribosylamine--glycine ligase, partial [Patescibacteria group bacterium]|nr:phosphoribosylamine--glycine ligase [Patescibacteria group bacterium]